MPRDDSVDDKTAALRERRSLNRRPEKVTDPAFLKDEFFDPRDLVQVKYEMLRRVEMEKKAPRKSRLKLRGQVRDLVVEEGLESDL